ncbi:MAG: hypothetical protein Q4C11_02250 [Clostridium sp.]|nr:hypothetical protein [Clostridium sp.]
MLQQNLKDATQMWITVKWKKYLYYLFNSVAIIVYEILRQVNFDGLQEIS